MTFMTNDLHDTRLVIAIARCQAKTTLKSYWHELRDHQEYSKKIAMKTDTHTQVPIPMTTVNISLFIRHEASKKRDSGGRR